jgi:hypothetical protein
LDIIRGELARVHPDHAGPALAQLVTHGKRGVVAIKRDQQSVSTSYAIPAGLKQGSCGWISLMFWMEKGEPLFGLESAPLLTTQKLQRAAAEAAPKLMRSGFRAGDGIWWSEHRPDAYLGADDVPARLVELIKQDMRKIARSGIHAGDVQRAKRDKRTRG